jgi:solute carrier family 35 protein E1
MSNSFAELRAEWSVARPMNLHPHIGLSPHQSSPRTADATAPKVVATLPNNDAVRVSQASMSAASALPSLGRNSEENVEAGSVEPGEQPWYGNLRTNTMACFGATVASRIALSFRNRAQRTPDASMNEETTKKGFLDFSLIICVALWYLGNYYYNITNKLALNAAGGSTGVPLTIATMQLGVGAIYALFLWLAPDARARPKITMADFKASLPVAGAAAISHAATVYSIGAGAVSFAQIVKASEPAFAALVGTLFYSASVSTAKWLSLIPVIGGVCLASLGELNFALAALIAGLVANLTAAIKGNENTKLMGSAGIADRFGSVGNIFAVTIINMFLMLVPVVALLEGSKYGVFFETLKTSSVLKMNLVASGLWFYLYNELATIVVKKTGAVTQSVLNTAKRVIVIVFVALVLGESLGMIKLIGCAIGIGGVFLYSIIDKLVAKK